MAKISVCIPTFNRKNFIAETFLSVYRQTYKNFEVVVLDDGSTDGTKEFIESLGFPVRYYWQENAGDAAARNKLIHLAEGDYISFLDSDDLLLDDSLERLMKKNLEYGGNVIVYGPYYRIDEKGNILGKSKKQVFEGDVTACLFDSIFVHSCGALFPINALRNEGGFDLSLKVCSDYLMWLILSTKYQFVGCSEPTFLRRRHSGNLSSDSTENRITELEVLERFYFNYNGQEYVPKSRAMKRLAKESYRVAKYATKENRADLAKTYYCKSLKYHFNLKTFLRYRYFLLKSSL